MGGRSERRHDHKFVGYRCRCPSVRNTGHQCRVVYDWVLTIFAMMYAVGGSVRCDVTITDGISEAAPEISCSEVEAKNEQ